MSADRSLQDRAGIRAVLFDLDGTLIDSAPDLAEAADRMRRDRGMSSLPLSEYRFLAGSGARGMLQVAFDATPEQPGFAALRDEFLVNYEQCMAQRTRLFPGVAELIGGIEGRGLAWGVVTNKATRFTEPLTRGMPLFARAATIVSGDTTAYSKPHPAPLFEAAKRLGLAPGHCIYVGDDERDMVAGRAAGMQTVAACYGYLGARGDTSLWGADAAIESPLALLELLT